MTIGEVEQAWLGIDFSGNHNMWRANRRSNVFIAEVEIQQERHFLRTLQTVQELPGQGKPFQRLADLLKSKRFNAAGIDAPFSVPWEYVPKGGHKAMLEFVAELVIADSRPFPAATDFVTKLLSGRSPSCKKPLRKTEAFWKDKGINVRSTLWAGPRGGAAMTAACLTLLHHADCPIWPWHPSDQGHLLVEAFPAAQLLHWGMKHQTHNGGGKEAIDNRKAIVVSVSKRIEIPEKFRKQMEESADALDAVLCAFAAIAVATGKLSQSPIEPADIEGWIAVHN